MKPVNTAICSLCSHSFGEHYQTYNDKKTGCSHVDDSQWEGTEHCSCKGFARIEVYKETPQTSYYDWRDH